MRNSTVFLDCPIIYPCTRGRSPRCPDRRQVSQGIPANPCTAYRPGKGRDSRLRRVSRPALTTIGCGCALSVNQNVVLGVTHIDAPWQESCRGRDEGRGAARTTDEEIIAMHEYGRFKRLAHCAKCGTLIGVFTISALGGEFVERHECVDMKADPACRTPHDLDPNHGPYPGNFGTRIVVTTATSGSSAATTSDIFRTINRPGS